MPGASQLIIAFFDLLEVEVLTARRGLVEATLGVGFGLAAALLALGSTALCLWALFELVDGTLTRPAAALVTAAAAMAAAALSTWVARRVAQ